MDMLHVDLSMAGSVLANESFCHMEHWYWLKNGWVIVEDRFSVAYEHRWIAECCTPIYPRPVGTQRAHHFDISHIEIRWKMTELLSKSVFSRLGAPVKSWMDMLHVDLSMAAWIVACYSFWCMEHWNRSKNGWVIVKNRGLHSQLGEGGEATTKVKVGLDSSYWSTVDSNSVSCTVFAKSRLQNFHQIKPC
jgi:hypothetical protein